MNLLAWSCRRARCGPHQVVQLCCLGVLEVRLKLRHAVHVVLLLILPMGSIGLQNPVDAVRTAWNACMAAV